MSRRSTRIKRRRLLSRRMGGRWSGHGVLMKFVTDPEWPVLVFAGPTAPVHLVADGWAAGAGLKAGDVVTFEGKWLVNEDDQHDRP